VQHGQGIAILVLIKLATNAPAEAEAAR